MGGWEMGVENERRAGVKEERAGWDEGNRGGQGGWRGIEEGRVGGGE